MSEVACFDPKSVLACQLSRHDLCALPRHRHTDAYVAVVLAGGYVEAGERGRWRARPGTVIFHSPFEAHLDVFSAPETIVLNLACSTITGSTAAGVIDDVDEIARAAERDPIEAAALIAAGVRPGADRLTDWPDLLADAMRDDPSLSISEWADRMGLDPASVSRGFKRCCGVSPKRFRMEVKGRRALGTMLTTDEPLARVAADAYFTDQAHMTRAVRALTGSTPGIIRAKSIQDIERSER